jgi:hypothetical protein
LDQHFIIWSLNGSEWLKSARENVHDELSELKRLNPRSISVVFDSERTSEEMQFDPVFTGFYDTCVELGFNVFATDRHSTENYISQSALDRVLGAFTALAPFERFGASKPKWNKNKNWLLFRDMAKEDLENTGLARFISDQLLPLVSAS